MVSRFSLILTVAIPLPSQTPLTLEEAVRRSLENYPSIRFSQEQSNAAAAAIRLARTAYLPKVDGLAQINRATRNNVYGMLLPQSVIPPISGPPNPNNDATNVWGTAIGFLVSWEPYDFGLRQAQVDAASAARRSADATLERTRFEVSVATADAYLTILAAQQTAEAARAAVSRAKVFDQSVGALVNAGLRPGAEGARARAELALADTQLIQAEEAIAVAKASLGQYVGSGVSLQLDPGRLFADAAVLESASAAALAHPALKEQQTQIDESKARQRILGRSYFPKLNGQAAVYARGTGANPDFTTGGAASGLGPNIHNWGIGFSVSLPIMDYASLRVKKEIESARERSESARYDLYKRELESRLDKARAQLEGARRVAANLPVQLEAARAAETQASARYRAGLGTIPEVAEAQRLLTQTEIDESLARLGVWRALLSVAAAQGDLQPFLQAARR